MNRLILMFVVMFNGVSAFGQGYFDSEQNSEEAKVSSQRWEDARKNLTENNIKSMKCMVTDMNGRTHPSRFYKFDDRGNYITNIFYDKNGIEKNKYENEFNSKNNVTKSTQFKKGKLKSIYESIYDDRGNMIESKYYDKDNEVSSRHTNNYNSNNLLTESINYRKDGKRISFKWQYEYYPNGSKKQQRIYKGEKLKWVVNYDCDELPKTEKQMMKDTSKICIKYEYDANGNKVKTIERHDSKGKLDYLERYTYDKNGNITKTEKSDKHLNFKLTQETTYNTQNLAIEYRNYDFKTQKIETVWFYNYADSGLLLGSYVVNKKNPRSAKYEYEKF